MRPIILSSNTEIWIGEDKTLYIYKITEKTDEIVEEQLICTIPLSADEHNNITVTLSTNK